MRVPAMNSCGRFERKNIKKNSVFRDSLNNEGKEIKKKRSLTYWLIFNVILNYIAILNDEEARKLSKKIVLHEAGSC